MKNGIKGRMRKKTLLSVFIILFSITSLILMVGFIFALTDLNLNSNVNVEYDPGGTVTAQQAGLYDSTTGELITSWETLISNGSIVVDNDSITSASSSLSGKIIIPEGVIAIGNRVFYNHTGITEVIIPESVEYIGERVFKGCSSLINVEFKNPNGWYSSDLMLNQYEVVTEDLSNGATAANYLKGLHLSKHMTTNPDKYPMSA